MYLGFSNDYSVDTCMKEKVQDGHNFWRNWWLESVPHFKGVHRSSQSTIWCVLRWCLQLKPYRLRLGQALTKTLLLACDILNLTVCDFFLGDT